MIRKHFIALADELRRSSPINFKPELSVEEFMVAIAQYRRDVERIADCLAEQNPRFDRDLWLSYLAGECGPNGEEVK